MISDLALLQAQLIQDTNFALLQVNLSMIAEPAFQRQAQFTKKLSKGLSEMLPPGNP